MNPRSWIVIGALLASAAVAAGALGAHGLENRLKLPESASQAQRDLAARKLHNFEVAARYQMYHALALVLVGIVGLWIRSAWLDLAALLFVGGIVLFSGMLYAWVFTTSRTLVMLVPLGGTAFILGWLAMAMGATSLPRDANRGLSPVDARSGP